ncbi:MAG: TrmH family RNA methyltransferase [Acidobacteriota bacterium]|nr:TrmH family RNA methyltransferase [Acidobacteriota bacterium]
MSDLKHQLAMERRLARRQRRREEYHRGLRPMAIAAWNITKEHNVGSLVRTAHAAAAAEVVLVGEREWNMEAAKTSELYTTVTQLADIEAFRKHLESRRWNLVAVELDHRAVNLFDAEYPERPCFLLGAEVGGLPGELLDEAEMVVQIPQWGLVPSLNLAIAGSIVVYDYLGKLHGEARLNRPDGGLLDQNAGEQEGGYDVDHKG